MKALPAILGVLLFAGGASALWYHGRDHLAVFDRRAGPLGAVDTLSHVVEVTDAQVAVRVVELQIRGSRGLAFRATVRRPDSAARLPGVLLLGGQRTGRQAASLPSLGVPAVQMAIDYPYQGPDLYSPGDFLLDLPKLRDALFDAAAASILAVDYLGGRADVDSLFVVGASFGAYFAPIAAAARSRVDGLAVLQGGGDLQKLLSANLHMAGVKRFQQEIGWVGAAILWPFEPTRWIGRVAPRPVLLVNSAGDERIPKHCVEDLYAAAGNPKEIVWIDSGHLHPTNTKLIAEMTREVERVFWGERRGAEVSPR